MFDRRQRILSHAQALLDELGVDGFTIRELSRRADVAQRTLYNVFGSKEDIVAGAIEAHYAALLAQLPPPPPADDIEGYLRRIDALIDKTIPLKRYASAMVGVFFSPAVDRRIHDTLRRISERGSGAWVVRAARSNLIMNVTPLDLERLSSLMINVGYANITDWVAERISETEMKHRVKLNFLICIQPLAKPARRPAIAALLDRVRRGDWDTAETSEPSAPPAPDKVA